MLFRGQDAGLTESRNLPSMKITIGVATNRGIRPQTVQCLLELVAHGGYQFHILVASEGYNTAENRNYISVQAIKNRSDYLFFIDDDMTFEPDVLDKLMAHKKEIVGVAYHPRTETPRNGSMDEVHIITLEKSTDEKYKSLFPCKAIGTGVMLIDTKVFSRIPRPWFAYEHYDTGMVKVGEDWWFCIEAGKVGIKVWCDPTIPIKHIGDKLY